MTTNDVLLVVIIVGALCLFARASTRLGVVLGWLDLANAPGFVRTIGSGIRPTDDHGRRPFIQLAVEIGVCLWLTLASVYALRPSSPYATNVRLALWGLIASELGWCALLAFAVWRARHR